MDEAKKQSQRSQPSGLTSLWLVARLFFRVNLGTRKIFWIGMLMLVPIGLSVYWRIAADGDGLQFFINVTVDAFLQSLAIGLPLYLGVSAVRDEIEDKTIVYLFARPVHRAVVLGGKIVSVALVVSVVLNFTLALVYLVVVSADGVAALGSGLDRLLLHLGVVTGAVVVYTALFALFGVLLRRPMILALLFGLGWEVGVSNLPGAFPQMTMMYYLKSLLGLGPEASGFIALLIPAMAPATTARALEVLIVVTVILFFAAFTIGSRKEYRL